MEALDSTMKFLKENSNRIYKVAFVDNNDLTLYPRVTLGFLLDGSEDSCELARSLQSWGIDSILDLRVGDTLTGEFRDSKNPIILIRVV